MAKCVIKGRIALTILRILTVISGVIAATLFAVYFYRTQALGIIEYLSILIPVALVGLLTISIIFYLNKVVKKIYQANKSIPASVKVEINKGIQI